MKKAFAILGLLVAVGLFIFGCMINIPSKTIKSVPEYIGGDAYNYIIEASLRGGQIAGGITARAIYISASGVLFVLSGIFLGEDLKADKKREISVKCDAKEYSE